MLISRPTRIVLFVTISLFAMLIEPALSAPIQPFDAIVQSSDGEEIYVRSGPGQERHYPTLKLSNGDQVHVLRKDPGGWYMIDPPPGSYSWILGRYVQKNGNQGTVTENGVIVRVGAFNSTQRDVEQIRMNRGDTVEILGEQILDSDKGKDLWIKIKPPRGEHRWIKGSHLVELNPDGTPKGIVKSLENKAPHTAPLTKDPSKSPEKHAPAIAEDGVEAEGGKSRLYGHSPGRKKAIADPFDDLEEGAATAPSLPYHSEDQAIREDLRLLDHELAQIIARPKAEWDFRVQREDLLALKQLAGKSALATQVDDRLTKLDGYEKLHEEALIAEQRARPTQPRGTQPIGPQQPNQVMPRVTQETTRNRVSPGNPSNGQAAPPGSRFNGAGIVHRLPNAPPGTPAYVIAAPDRRILCYLDSAPGINLDKYVGQPMGVIGPRGYDPRLRADRMRVDSLAPVRLAQ